MNHLLSEIKKWTFPLWIGIIIYGSSGSLFAQEDLLIDKFIGSWSGKGLLFGMEAEFTMKWERVLQKQFVHLIFQNSFKDSEGHERIFKAQAFYKFNDENQFQGSWFDSRGMTFPLKANIGDSALTTLWGSPETEEGKTIYQLVGDGKLDVNDFILKEGQWKKFGHAIYHRIDKN